jgi:hypothetical protein
MAMEFKNEYPLKEDKDIDEFEDESEVEPLTKKKPPEEKDGRNGANKKQEVLLNFFIEFQKKNIFFNRKETVMIVITHRHQF